MDNLIKVLSRAWGEAEQQTELIGIACRLVERQITREAAAVEIMNIVSEMADGGERPAVLEIESGQDEALTA